MNNNLATVAFLCSWSLSRAPGNIVDWMYKKMGVKYSFAAHLRDTGTVGYTF
jgi:extracellular matrix protein 14